MVIAFPPPGEAREAPETLIGRAQAGDSGAFAALFEEHGRLVRGMIGHFNLRDDAPDVEQEVWSRVAANLGTLREASRFVPWLKAIVRNTCLTFVNDRNRRRAHVSSYEALHGGDAEHDDVASGDVEDEAGETPERTLLSHDDQRKVWETMGSMSERDRLALHLRAYEEVPYTEIAERLGISRNAAEVCVLRARERFRGAFARVDDAAPPLCGVDGLRLSALVGPGMLTEHDRELRVHVDGCAACQSRLAKMRVGRSRFPQLGMFALPLPGGGLLGWLGGLVSRLGLLVPGGSAASGAGSATVGAAAVSTTALSASGVIGVHASLSLLAAAIITMATSTVGDVAPAHVTAAEAHSTSTPRRAAPPPVAAAVAIGWFEPAATESSAVGAGPETAEAVTLRDSRPEREPAESATLDGAPSTPEPATMRVAPPLLPFERESIAPPATAGQDLAGQDTAAPAATPTMGPAGDSDAPSEADPDAPAREPESNGEARGKGDRQANVVSRSDEAFLRQAERLDGDPISRTVGPNNFIAAKHALGPGAAHRGAPELPFVRSQMFASVEGEPQDVSESAGEEGRAGPRAIVDTPGRGPAPLDGALGPGASQQGSLPGKPEDIGERTVTDAFADLPVTSDTVG